MSSEISASVDDPVVIRAAKLHPLVAGMAWATLAVLVGGGLLAEANGTIDALIVSGLALVLGILISSIPGLADRYAQRAFLLTFANCVLAAGLCQVYSVRLFGEPVSVTDEIRFAALIPTGPPYLSLWEWRGILKGALATYVWQEWYLLLRALGFEHGPYLGVLANSLVMGLSATLAVRAAGEVFGRDDRRLSVVGILFSLCGTFLIFGAILIRDCFVILVNLVVLWGLLGALKRPTLIHVGAAAAGVAAGMVCMEFLRSHAVYMFSLIAAMAVGCWYWENRGTLVRMTLLVAISITAIVGWSYLDRIAAVVGGELRERDETYLGFAEESSGEDSVGLKYVVHQPLPIRLALGSFALLAFPIPFWGQLRVGEGGFFVLQTYHALYALWVVPMALAGAFLVFRRDRSSNASPAQTRFLVLYTLVGLLAVVATSREGRHFAPFYPGLLLLAVIPDRAIAEDRSCLYWMRVAWIGAVAAAHVAWAVLRY